MDAVGVDRAVLIGCSQGGRIAVDAALARPDRVHALVLVAPAVTGAPQAVLDDRLRRLSDAIGAASAAGDVDAVNELEAQLWLDGPTSRAERVKGPARRLFLHMNGIALRAADPGKAIDEPSAWERLHQIAMPSLLVWGDLDLAPVQALCEAMVQRLPNAQRAVLSDTAHLPPLEDPAPFNAEVQRFLGLSEPLAAGAGP